MQKRMLHGTHLSVFEAKSREDLDRECGRFTRQLEFATFTASAVIDYFRGDAPAFVSVDNTPAAFREAANDLSLARRDPVMQHCKRHSVPLAWGQSHYVNAGQADLWEHQAQYGFRCGLVMATHLSNGRHFIFGVDRDRALPQDAEQLAGLTADLLMFAIHAQDAALRILLSDAPAKDAPCLTPRELETLRWTLDGKTAWEVGRILGIAENTVIRHAQQAMHKLDCTSKHHAAIKALRLGLIQ